MTKKLNTLLYLNKIVTEMEHDLGLTDLGTLDKNVLLAVCDIVEDNGSAKTKDILCHEMTRGISRPTVFRALKKLEDLGHIKRDYKGAGMYQLSVANK